MFLSLLLLFADAGVLDIQNQIDAALNLHEIKEYVVAFDPLCSAPPALAAAPAMALPLGAPAREPAPLLDPPPPCPLDTLLSRLTACVDSLCKGELTLHQTEMKLALACPSCSADLRAVDDAALKLMRARPAADADEAGVSTQHDAFCSIVCSICLVSFM